MSPEGFDPAMSIPGIAWGEAPPGFDGDPMSIPGIAAGVPALPGLPMSIPGMAPEPAGFAVRFGDDRAALRAAGFAFLAAGLALAAGFLAGIGMFMPGMPCMDWANAVEGAASASAETAASAAARRVMPPLPSGER
jgi:hypothetical protein